MLLGLTSADDPARVGMVEGDRDLPQNWPSLLPAPGLALEQDLQRAARQILHGHEWKPLILAQTQHPNDAGVLEAGGQLAAFVELSHFLGIFGLMQDFHNAYLACGHMLRQIHGRRNAVTQRTVKVIVL